MASGSGLELALDVARPAVAGLPVLALLHVVNRGAEARIVSARLNLMEGDVAFVVEEEDGAVRRVAGWQADTPLRRVELPPGCRLVGAVLLLETPEGEVFPRPGAYRLTAEYRPSPREEAVASAPVSVTAVAPSDGDETALAGLLDDPAVRRAILLADPESAPAALREIGERFGGTLAGRLARLVSGTEGAADSAAADPAEQALAILALRNPYSNTGIRLAEAYAQALPAADGPGQERARRLVGLEPVPADEPLPVPG